MKLFVTTVVFALLATATQGASMTQQGKLKCNAKTKSPSIASGSQSTQQWSSAASQATQQPSQQWSSTSSQSTQQGSAQQSTASSQSSPQGSTESSQSTTPSSSDSSQSTQQGSTASSQSTQQGSAAASQSTQQGSSDSSQSTQQGSQATATSACTLTGTYSQGADVSKCKNIVIKNLSVPKGVTLDLTTVADGAAISFEGTSTFAMDEWEGPLILLTGNDLTVSGTGTLDGQGEQYWKQGTSITRPVFFRLKHVKSSTLKGFHIKNSPYRTFSILDSEDTTISGLTLDSRAGDNVAKNTDGFDLSRNVRLTISGCTVYNQDDCLAMQSSNDTTFTGNTCSGGHGISIGSLGGDSVTESDIVSGLTVKNNKILDSVNGIRIKTIIGKEGSITGASYTDNALTNVKNAIVIHSDYSKEKGGYTGDASSLVEIADITVSGMSGTADNIYDILVNPKVVSGWKFSGVTVSGSKGSCSGQPSGVSC